MLKLFKIAQLIKFLAGKRTIILVSLAVITASFTAGAMTGWNAKKSSQVSANMKAVEKDVKTKVKLDEIRNTKPDRDGLLDLLRHGKY